MLSIWWGNIHNIFWLFNSISNGSYILWACNVSARHIPAHFPAFFSTFYRHVPFACFGACIRSICGNIAETFLKNVLHIIFCLKRVSMIAFSLCSPRRHFTFMIKCRSGVSHAVKRLYSQARCKRHSLGTLFL